MEFCKPETGTNPHTHSQSLKECKKINQRSPYKYSAFSLWWSCGARRRSSWAWEINSTRIMSFSQFFFLRGASLFLPRARSQLYYPAELCGSKSSPQSARAPESKMTARKLFLCLNWTCLFPGPFAHCDQFRCHQCFTFLHYNVPTSKTIKLLCPIC